MAHTHYLITANHEAIGVTANSEAGALQQALLMGIQDIVVRVDLALTEAQWAATTAVTQRDIDNLKADGQYREAGAASFAKNPRDRSYGCHFGMRSGLQWAREQFYAGFDEAEREARHAGAQRA